MSGGKKRKKDKKPKGPKRTERRFLAQSANNPWLVRAAGGVGAALLGAGAYDMAYGHIFENDDKLRAIPAYLVAAGAVLSGAAIWLGTSSELPIRVGAPGIAMERGELRRITWAGLDKISYDSGAAALSVRGVDESGASTTFRVPIKSHGEAAGWILKEALDRVPKRVDITDETLEKLPGASPHTGTQIQLEALQVVGRKDAVTGVIISYEPDARVCARCERIYHKRSVPKRCKCGASLLHLRATVVDAAYADDEEQVDADDEEHDVGEADAETSDDDDNAGDDERPSKRSAKSKRSSVDETEAS